MRQLITFEDFQLHQKWKIILLSPARPDMKPNPSMHSWDRRFSIQKVSGMVRKCLFIRALIAFFTVNIYHNLPWHLSHAVNHRHMMRIIICRNNLFAITGSCFGLSVNLCHTTHITISGFVLFIYFLVSSLLTSVLQFSKVWD